MGGNAFANHEPPLPTPRLSPDEYRRVRDTLVGRLREHFHRVAVPIEGPAKPSYGDVDILVSDPISDPPCTEPLGNTAKDPFTVYASLLETVLQSTARCGSSFAVSKTHVLSESTEPESASEPTSTYVQVDITVLPSQQFAWSYFMHCHGDMWNMLSPSLRRVGLVLTDRGLCLINPTIAPHDRKRSRLPLTDDPNTVLDFLGLSSAVFWGQDARLRSAESDGSVPELFGEPGGALAGRRFATEADHFAFVASSRFFVTTAYQTTDLKSHDRRRMKLRSAYGRFVRDFVPQADDRGTAFTYQDTIQEALDHFGKREEYDAMQNVWNEEQEALQKKQLARETRKHLAQQDIGYADAWMGHLA